MQNIDKYITKRAIEALRKLITENGGSEVFCIGYRGSRGKVENIRIISRGNEYSTPAILETAEFGTVSIHNHPGGNLTPSSNDISLAAEFGAAGVGSFIVNNDVTEINVVVEPFSSKETNLLDLEMIRSLFVSGGPFSSKSHDFEYRPQQLKMADDVVRLFNEDKIGLIEAGTGVGKSLAYLVPAVYWAVENKQRIVVSTNTINLQEQLIKKDIPFVRDSLGLNFTAVLMKGRNNYLCLRKAYNVKRDPTQQQSLTNPWEVSIIFDWMERTKDGSKSDLNFNPSTDTWDLLSCESETCTRAKCKYFSRCFFFEARRSASKAHLIVTNHNLLMADTVIKGNTGDRGKGILPPYHKLIIDEAHHLEDVATSYLGGYVSPFSFFVNMGRIQSLKTHENGILPSIGTSLRRIIDQSNRLIVAKINKSIEDALPMKAKKTHDETERYFHEIASEVLSRAEFFLKDGYEYKVRVSKEFENSSLWVETVKPAIKEIVSAFEPYISTLQGILSDIYKLNEKALDTISDRLIDVEGIVLKLKVHLAFLQSFLEESDTECRWIEIKKKKKRYLISLHRAPLKIASQLKEILFEEYKSVVMTSATLSIGGDFQFIKERLGVALLSKERVFEDVLDSPYDYENRVMVGIPTDVAEPNSKQFARDLVELLMEELPLVDGRTFVLFTSYSLLGRVYDMIEGDLLKDGFVCLRQGYESRYKLLERFQTNSKAVLFATSSFWEGVDVKGEALLCVVITKLPFQVPTEPIVEARIEEIKASGGHPFYQYTVPYAIIRFKQGFGRLIRSKKDWGIVLIHDKRVLTKNYGKLFLNSLPRCAVRATDHKSLLQEMKKFRSSFIK